MTELFDPYHTWLGIPPEEQPPNHYRLLGIPLFEERVETIDHAANQRMGYLRTLQSGKHSAESQQLLNQVAAARVCLLNLARKSRYDAHLREELAAEAQPSPAEIPAIGVQPAAEPQAATEGSTFGEYQLLQRLGGDEGGGVFKARHCAMGRVVALKLLEPGAGQTPERVERFRRKAKILAQLSHPNLVAAYDAGQRQGTYYLVMEYVDGRDLAAILAEFGPLPVGHVVGYLSHAAAGLGCAHQHGIYHRNVKPSNLLLDRHGVVKLIGLGLARVDFDALAGQTSFGSEITAAGRVMGTFDYISPEQSVDSTKVDARSDVYSLGCTLYKLLTGQVVYPVKSWIQKLLAHRSAAIPSLRAARPDVPPRLEAAFFKMLAKRPEDRLQSMNEVIRALAQA